MDNFFVSAGFPSPAEPWREAPLDLQALLVPHPASTFFVRVQGHSMQGAGIYEHDLLVVDRALTATNNAIIVAELRGGFTVKRIRFDGDTIILASEHPRYPTFPVTPAMHFHLWGVVTVVIHALHPYASLSGEHPTRKRLL